MEKGTHHSVLRTPMMFIERSLIGGTIYSSLMTFICLEKLKILFEGTSTFLEIANGKDVM